MKQFLCEHDEQRYNYFSTRWEKMFDNNYEKEKLYYCKAFVYKNPETNELFLRSFDTIIAYCNPSVDIIYDRLRTEYHYTNTSNQHLHKFVRYIREKYLHSMKAITLVEFRYKNNGVIYTVEGDI